MDSYLLISLELYFYNYYFINLYFLIFDNLFTALTGRKVPPKYGLFLLIFLINLNLI